MHVKLQRYIEDGFMTEEQAVYIEQAIANGDTLIASGHRSAGIRNLMAATMAMVMEKYKTVKVRTLEDVSKEADYLLLAGMDPEGFTEQLQAAFNRPGIAVVTLKDPDHPYSVMKMLMDAYKVAADAEKAVVLMECNKVDGEPRLIKFSRFTYGDNGRPKRQDS